MSLEVEVIYGHLDIICTLYVDRHLLHPGPKYLFQFFIMRNSAHASSSAYCCLSPEMCRNLCGMQLYLWTYQSCFNNFRCCVLPAAGDALSVALFSTISDIAAETS